MNCYLTWQAWGIKGLFGLIPKFWPLFGWVSKFVHLSHFPYQNVGKFFTCQNFGTNPSRPMFSISPHVLALTSAALAHLNRARQGDWARTEWRHYYPVKQPLSPWLMDQVFRDVCVAWFNLVLAFVYSTLMIFKEVFLIIWLQGKTAIIPLRTGGRISSASVEAWLSYYNNWLIHQHFMKKKQNSYHLRGQENLKPSLQNTKTP